MLRPSELVSLNIGEVTLLLAVRKSKTDQAGQGESVCLADLTRSGVAFGLSLIHISEPTRRS